MLDIFGSLRLILKRRNVEIDNTVFRLHWLFTCFLLIMFSVVLTARQYVGEPINCFAVTNAPPSLLNTYCWVHATYTIEESFGKRVGYDIPHPGIDNSRLGTKKYYPYYQWVCFVLFLQAILFYVPHYIWKVWEGGLIEAICMGLTQPVLTEEDRAKRCKLLIGYLNKSYNRHRTYALKYFLCEFFCVLNVFGQMWLLDRFFDGEFWKYGTKVVQFSQDNQELRVDPMVYVFPRMTKCSFYTFGPSGDVQTHDTLCILPLNVVNEKIFIFLWFWFVVLATMTLSVLVHRIVVIACPFVRPHFLHIKCMLVSNAQLKKILKTANVGDWFLLYMLGKNLDSLVFQDVVGDLYKRANAKLPEKNGKDKEKDLVNEEEDESLA